MQRVRLLDRPCLSLATHDGGREADAALPVPSYLPASLPSINQSLPNPSPKAPSSQQEKRSETPVVGAESSGTRSINAQTDRAAYS